MHNYLTLIILNYLFIWCSCPICQMLNIVVKMHVIHLPHVHLSEVQNGGGGMGSKHSCDGVGGTKVESEEGFIGEGHLDC